MRQDAERWDARYADAEPAEPSPPDAVVAGGLDSSIPTSGRALDVACGRGAQAAWAARRGLDVVALDVSPAAIDLTHRSAGAAGVGDRVDVRVTDLDEGLPDDLGAFDLVICQRFRGPGLYASFVEHLAPGGMAVVTVLSREGASSPGPFHAPSRELADAFELLDVELLHHEIGEGQESVVVRRPST